MNQFFRLGQLRRGTDLLGNTFRIEYGAEAALEVELIEATGLRSRPPRPGQPPRREPFSIVFRGPKTIVLPQRMYKISHEKFGPLDLFIVPIGPDDTGMCYEAVFT